MKRRFLFAVLAFLPCPAFGQAVVTIGGIQGTNYYPNAGSWNKSYTLTLYDTETMDDGRVIERYRSNQFNGGHRFPLVVEAHAGEESVCVCITAIITSASGVERGETVAMWGGRKTGALRRCPTSSWPKNQNTSASFSGG